MHHHFSAEILRPCYAPLHFWLFSTLAFPACGHASQGHQQGMGARWERYFHTGKGNVGRQSWPWVSPCRTCLCLSPMADSQGAVVGCAGYLPHPDHSHRVTGLLSCIPPADQPRQEDYQGGRASLRLARAVAAVCSGRN